MGIKLEISTPNEWHVLKSETQYGPYTYEEMLQMLQNKTLFSFDYIWAPHLESWTNLSEVEEFSADRISQIQEKNKANEVFLQRKYDRVDAKLPVIVHNNLSLWRGTVESLSQGGAMILMDNPMLLPGDQITIHFRQIKEDAESFNVRAEIISKRLTRQKIEHDSLIYYAVQFNLMQPQGEKEIKDYVKNKGDDK